MADVMKSSPKPPAKAKKVVAPRRTTKDIPTAAKSRGPASSAHAAEEEEDENVPILRKLRPTLPIHNAAHPIVEDMKKRKDAGLRKWTANDPYVVRRRTVVYPRFHTKEQQDFSETVLFDKSPAVSDMGRSTGHISRNMRIYFPKSKRTSVTDGHKYKAAIAEWAAIIGSPKEEDRDVDAYAEAKQSHSSMANMYKTIPHNSVQGMEKDIQEILQIQKSLERVMETKFHDMDVKVSELTTIVKQLQHEVDSVEIPHSEDEGEDDDDDDEESPPPTTTQFSTRPRSAVVPAQETRQTSSAQALAPSAPAPAQEPSV
ncbi:hypothetical protein ZWY2020_042383 [Hordeum vulgare]|nr:hypothetical protein ZWY2020_042383 [Hordeum vulgare]